MPIYINIIFSTLTFFKFKSVFKGYFSVTVAQFRGKGTTDSKSGNIHW